jgi:cell division protein FtsB
MPPQFILPFCAVVFAIAAVIGEGIFLAPVMDGFGIAELSFQLIFAAVIVITTSGLFEITKKIYAGRTHEAAIAEDSSEQKEQQKSRRVGSLILIGLLTTLSLALVFILGWWRAEEMIYAASVQTGAWKDFLTNNPVLTRAVVVLLTTALPVFVALTFEWGLNGVHLAWEWRKSRAIHKRVAKQLDQTQKRLEQEIEAKDSRKRALEQMGEEWKQAYLQNHDLGQKTGAWKLPLWRVVLKIGAVALLVLTLCLALEPLIAQYILSDAMRWLLYTCLTLGTGVLFAAYAIKAWDRPTAQQLYDQKATMFRSDRPPYDPQPVIAVPPSAVEGNGKRSATAESGRAATA